MSQALTLAETIIKFRDAHNNADIPISKKAFDELIESIEQAGVPQEIPEVVQTVFTEKFTITAAQMKSGATILIKTLSAAKYVNVLGFTFKGPLSVGFNGGVLSTHTVQVLNHVTREMTNGAINNLEYSMHLADYYKYPAAKITQIRIETIAGLIGATGGQNCELILTYSAFD